MDDYISRQAAIDAFRKELCREREYIISFKGCERVLSNVPSADVQPVVRCKDCKHSTKWYRDKRRCFLWREDGIDVFEDGYCSYWERKDSEQNDG